MILAVSLGLRAFRIMLDFSIMSGSAIPFEDNLKELQTTVQLLETGELTLEQALKNFERGVELTRICQTELSKAEKKVELLLKKENGVAHTKSFSSEK